MQVANETERGPKRKVPEANEGSGLVWSGLVALQRQHKADWTGLDLDWLD